MHAGRGLTFFFDEWNFVLNRIGHSPDVFLRPHNEHASVVPVAIYKVLFETVGLGHYWVYLLVHVVLMELLAVLVYLYARPRVGRWWALFPALALAVVGSAPTYVLQTFELSFTLSLIGGVGAALAFDAGTRRGDAAGAALLVLSLFSSGVGLAILLAAIVEVALRPDRRARAWVVAGPALLYAAWWVPYHAGHYPLANLSHTPRYVEVMYVTGVGTLTSLSALAAPLAIALAIAILAAVAGTGGRRPRFWFIALAPLAFWFSTAMVRYGISEPDGERYAYPSAVLLALLVCEVLRDRTPRPPNARVVAVAGAGLALLLLNNVGLLAAYDGGIPQFSRILRPELGALELARAEVSPDYKPDPGRAPDIVAGKYFAAVDRYGGSPGDGPDQIARDDPDGRAAADALLFAALHLGGTPVRAVPSSGVVRCARAAGRPLLLTLTGRNLFVDNAHGKAPVTVTMRRFGDGFSPTLATVAPGTVTQTTVPAAALARHPWIARLTSGSPFRACVTR